MRDRRWSASWCTAGVGLGVLVSSSRNMHRLEAGATQDYRLEAGATELDRMETGPTRVFAAALDSIAASMVRIDTVGGALPVTVEEDGKGRSVAAPMFRQADGPTTGVVWSADGYIVSSSFNFMREPSVTTVTLADGRRLVARLIARDRGARLALLQVAASDLPLPSVVPAAEIRAGQWALAAGFGHGTRVPTMSVGVVSALARTQGLTIQTDAKISPANYGGPLFDVEGRLLGVCVPMAGSDETELAGVEWYDSGIGFAVTVEEIERRVERLKAGRDLLPGYLGAEIAEATAVVTDTGAFGVRIAAALPGTGGDSLEKDDRIVLVDGQAAMRPLDVKRALARRFAGDAVEVMVVRGGERRMLTVTLMSQAELRKRLGELAATQAAASAPAGELGPVATRPAE